jgi:hypothetical protein
MKNTFAIFAVFTVCIAAVLGCSSINPFSDKSKPNQPNATKTLTDKAVDTAVGEETTGIPECDEVLNLLTKYAEDPADSFVVKAGKAVFVNKIKETIRKSIEENKGDKKEIAKNCRDAKVQLEKSKAEEEKKKAK